MLAFLNYAGMYQDYNDICKTLGNLIITTLLDLPADPRGSLDRMLIPQIKAEQEKLSNLLKSELAKLGNEPELKEAA